MVNSLDGQVAIEIKKRQQISQILRTSWVPRIFLLIHDNDDMLIFPPNKLHLQILSNQSSSHLLQSLTLVTDSKVFEILETEDTMGSIFCVWLTPRKHQPEGLEVDDGTFELDNLMEVWGRRQGLKHLKPRFVRQLCQCWNLGLQWLQICQSSNSQSSHGLIVSWLWFRFNKRRHSGLSERAHVSRFQH